MLINLLHRGACGCEANTGDGAGILIQMPDRFFRKVAPFALPRRAPTASGSCSCRASRGSATPSATCSSRSSPRKASSCSAGATCRPTTARSGPSAVAVEPVIEQVFIGRAPGLAGADARVRFERKLYVIRKRFEHAIDALRLPDRREAVHYVVSLSCNTLIYKGMLTADQIQPMFPDLTDPDVESALALVHQRFSTNTFPSWPLAHPYRYVAHNGEINTLRGNINWMRAREGLLRSDVFGDDLQKVLPIIREGGSDTATFDNVLEFLVMTGRSLPHAVLMMIPEPWAGHESMRPRSGPSTSTTRR